MLKPTTASVHADIINRWSQVMPVSSAGSSFQVGETKSSAFDQHQHNNPLLRAVWQQAPAALLSQQTLLADVSPAAQLIDHALQQAQAKGTSAEIEATRVVTRFPYLPEIMAQDLRHAITHSGLFYESHLRGFAEGQRSLAEILQQPQNQSMLAQQTILPQQLSVLETQRIVWHGEVWPQQYMHWQIEFPQGEQREQSHAQATTETPERVVSAITLTLPNLGKVTAKINLSKDGLNIQFMADDPHTRSTLKSHMRRLSEAMNKNGQVVQSLTVDADE